jgi:Mce-associated membrane protein
MPFRRRTSSVLNDDRTDAADAEPVTDPDEALMLAEEAEAEAAEAEALAAAARARAKAIRLRKAAQTTRSATTGRGEAEATEPAQAVPAEVVEAIEDEGVADAATTTADGTDVGAEPGKAVSIEAADPDTQEPDTDAADIDEADTDAADPAGVKATGVAAAAERRRTRRRRIRRPGWKMVAAVVSVLCTLALLTLSGLMIWHHVQADKRHQHTAEFEAAARQGVVTLMSLNFNSANDDIQRIIDNTTGQFKADFEQQKDSFIRVAQESKVVTDASVKVDALETIADDANSGVVLVAAETKVTNAAGAKEEPRAWRLSVSLAREGDQLKMSKVEFVP